MIVRGDAAFIKPGVSHIWQFVYAGAATEKHLSFLAKVSGMLEHRSMHVTGAFIPLAVIVSI